MVGVTSGLVLLLSLLRPITSLADSNKCDIKKVVTSGGLTVEWSTGDLSVPVCLNAQREPIKLSCINGVWQNDTNIDCQYLVKDAEIQCPEDHESVTIADELACVLISQPQEYSDLCYRGHFIKDRMLPLESANLREYFKRYKEQNKYSGNEVWISDRFFANDNFWLPHVKDHEHFGSLELYENCFTYNFESKEIRLDDCSRKYPIVCSTNKSDKLLLPLGCPFGEYSVRYREYQQYCFSIQFIEETSLSDDFNITELFDPVSKIKLKIHGELVERFNVNDSHLCLVNVEEMIKERGPGFTTINKNSKISLSKHFNCIVRMRKIELQPEPKIKLQLSLEESNLQLIVHNREFFFREENTTGITCYIGAQKQQIILPLNENDQDRYVVNLSRTLPQQYRCFGRTLKMNKLIVADDLSLGDFKRSNELLFSALLDIQMNDTLWNIVNNKSHNITEFEAKILHVIRQNVEESAKAIRNLTIYRIMEYKSGNNSVIVNASITTTLDIATSELEKLLRTTELIQLITVEKINSAKEEHYKILNRITMIGNILSLISILVLFINAIYHNMWLRLLKNEIIIQFAISVGLQTTIFVIGIFLTDYMTSHGLRIPCVMIGGLIQYFLLVTYTWPLIISIRLYSLYTNYLGYKKLSRNYFRKVKLMVWCFPIAIPVILVSILPNQYSSSPEKMFFANICYPRKDARKFGNLVPIGIVSTASVIILISAAIKTIFSKEITKDIKKFQMRQMRIPALMILFLFFNWVFGVTSTAVSNPAAKSILEYCVSLTTPYSGFIAFILYFVCDPIAHRYWMNRFHSVIIRNY